MHNPLQYFVVAEYKLIQFSSLVTKVVCQGERGLCSLERNDRLRSWAADCRTRSHWQQSVHERTPKPEALFAFGLAGLGFTRLSRSSLCLCASTLGAWKPEFSDYIPITLFDMVHRKRARGRSGIAWRGVTREGW